MNRTKGNQWTEGEFARVPQAEDEVKKRGYQLHGIRTGDQNRIFVLAGAEDRFLCEHPDHGRSLRFDRLCDV